MANPEAITEQEGHKEDQTIIEIEVTIDNEGSEPNPDPLPEELELHSGLPPEVMTNI